MDSAQPDDRNIVVLLKNGDPHGLEVLYDRYVRVVFALIVQIVGNRQVAEELTQEVFLRVWRQVSSFDSDRGTFTAWVLAIAHNAAVDEIRRGKSRPKASHDRYEESRMLLEVSDQASGPEELVLGGIRRETVLEALAQLPEDQRKVLEMSYYEGLTQAEIAERMGIPLGTIKTRTRRALERLRARFLSEGGQGEIL